MRLNKGCGNDYADRLEEEGYREGATCFGIYESGICEEEAAAEEAEYGGQRFDPAVWVIGRLIGCAESKEDGVSWAY